jgi:hypothetical protein
VEEEVKGDDRRCSRLTTSEEIRSLEAQWTVAPVGMLICMYIRVSWAWYPVIIQRSEEWQKVVTLAVGFLWEYVSQLDFDGRQQAITRSRHGFC